MRSEGNRWDPATVVGLKSSDHVLVIGNAAFMPWITDVCKNVVSARRAGEINSLLSERAQFDKVIISREMPFSAELISQAGPLVRRGDGESGVLVALPADDGWSTTQAISFFYPESNVWSIDSTFGLFIIAGVAGVSWRFYNG